MKITLILLLLVLAGFLLILRRHQVVRTILWMAMGGLLLWTGWWLWSNRSKDEKANEQIVASGTPANYMPSNGLVLMKDCYTPCTVYINYPFVIMRIDALKIKWHGVEKWMDYPREWDLHPPPEMTSGNTEFVSGDKNIPHVRMQVYKNTTGRW